MISGSQSMHWHLCPLKSSLIRISGSARGLGWGGSLVSVLLMAMGTASVEGAFDLAELLLSGSLSSSNFSSFTSLGKVGSALLGEAVSVLTVVLGSSRRRRLGTRGAVSSVGVPSSIVRFLRGNSSSSSVVRSDESARGAAFFLLGGLSLDCDAFL